MSRRRILQPDEQEIWHAVARTANADWNGYQAGCLQHFQCRRCLFGVVLRCQPKQYIGV